MKLIRDAKGGVVSVKFTLEEVRERVRQTITKEGNQVDPEFTLQIETENGTTLECRRESNALKI